MSGIQRQGKAFRVLGLYPLVKDLGPLRGSAIQHLTLLAVPSSLFCLAYIFPSHLNDFAASLTASMISQTAPGMKAE